MAFLGTTDFFLRVKLGEVPGYSLVHKYGKSSSIGTSWSFVSSSGTYQTPTSDQSLEIVSTSAQDGVGGTGIRTVYVEGIDGSGNVQSETVTMNGTTAVALVNTYLRVYRAYGTTSGTYATISSSSQAGTITIQGSGGGVTWLSILVDGGIGLGQTLTTGYTVPSGYDWAVYVNSISVDSSKLADIAFFKRLNILDATSPYDGVMRVSQSITGASGVVKGSLLMPIDSGSGPADLGFFAKITSGTVDVAVDYFILLKAV